MALAAVVVASWPFGRGQGLLLAVAAAAIGCLVPGVTAHWVRGLPVGIALLGAAFLIRLQLDPGAVAPWTPLVAGWLLLIAELGYWSYELDGASTVVAGGLARRALEVVLLALAAAAACELLADVGSLIPAFGGWLLVAGVLAATGPPAILLRLARRSQPA